MGLLLQHQTSNGNFQYGKAILSDDYFFIFDTPFVSHSLAQNGRSRDYE